MVLSPLPAVAAVIQRNAEERGVWMAPANISLTATLRATRTPLDAQELIESSGIQSNLIRSFVGKKVLLWGCRTLLNDDTSCWRFIQTRLLINDVENVLRDLAKNYVFEPNNAQTWMKLKAQAWTWLQQLWLAGAFYGVEEEDAFSVDIGLGETMSEQDIREGKMVLLVRLALMAPAEFIDINLTLNLRDSSSQIDVVGELACRY